MRLSGGLATSVVVLFWLLMNGRLVLREYEYRSLDQYRRGVADFLGDRIRRERWMGVYRRQKRIGHTGLAVERSFEGDRLGYRVEFSTRLEIDVLGQGGRIAIEGAALLDPRMVPLDLTVDVAVGTVKVQLTGSREDEHFVVALKDQERSMFRERLPLRELHFGDGLAPLPPIAGLRVGERYRVPVFDPVFRASAPAESTVVRETSRLADGMAIDCLEIETAFRGMVIRSFVTRDGEVLRQEIPPPLEVVLIREPAPARRDRP